MNYNGISPHRECDSWKRLCFFYKGVKESELITRLESGIDKLAAEIGFELDESIYNLNLKLVAELMEVDFQVFILKVWGAWNELLEIVLADLVIIGTGECQNCGIDDLDFFDCGENEPDILQCRICKHKQYEK